ncbi:MAG: hypothetical protein J6Q73_09705 [Bacteroidaceae bacterium]|nr:hypothetical protein [Bacteroidaceae bacterium]
MRKHVGPNERFYESFTEAFAYMEQHRYRLARHPRTCYIDGAWNQEAPEKWLFNHTDSDRVVVTHIPALKV